VSSNWIGTLHHLDMACLFREPALFGGIYRSS